MKNRTKLILKISLVRFFIPIPKILVDKDDIQRLCHRFACCYFRDWYYMIHIESPKLKKRYFSSTAVL